MDIKGQVAVVTGGASGMGRATAERLVQLGAKVLITDLSTSAGEAVAQGMGAEFFAGDVTGESDMQGVFAAAERLGSLRATVHCAGRGGTMRVVERDGSPGSLEMYEAIVRLNLVGSFNVLRLAATAMAKLDPVDDERGVVVFTASAAAYEGQPGQLPYASSKAGVVGLTLVSARDLAARRIRVCAIAPGLFDTPMLARLPDESKQVWSSHIPHPKRLGRASEYALLATHIIENPYLNGETIRLDGALRMPLRF